MAEQFAVIGKRIPVLDAYEKVTGILGYAVDMTLPGMLVAKVLRSPYAHARILRIDTSKAEALPGVEAVITHQDVPKEEWLDRSFNYLGRVLDNRVRFVGDEVAAVAAVDKYVAEAALNLIEIDWQELPHVFDIMEAAKPDAPQLTTYPTVRNALIESHGNVRSSVIEVGNLDKGLRDADLVVEHETTMGNQQSAPIGRNACLASWEGQKLTIWTSTQTPFPLRDQLAKSLKLPQQKVRVINLPTGASQGLWWANNFHFITAYLAKKARRPVKLDLTQEECFATVKRRETPISWAKLGVKRDGTFTAIHFKHYFDNGAYGYKFYPYESVSDLWGGQKPAIKFEFYGVNTNTLTAGCMRGVGDLTMTFCMEQVIDKAAEALGMGPLEIRLKNHIRAGDPIHSQANIYKRFGVPFPGEYLSSGALDECITKGAERIGWNQKWKGWSRPSAVHGTKRRGLGMAVACHISGGRHLGCPTVVIKVNHDGSINLLTGVGRMGQGVETTQAQIAAEELGVPVESIVGTHADTEVCPWSPGTLASVNAHQTGLATRAAAADAKRQILQLASRHLEVRPEDLDIMDGRIFVKEQPKRGLAFAEMTSKVHPEFLTPPYIIGQASTNLPPSLIAKMFMAHFVEVEVDTENGEVKLLDFVAVHDSGTIINPEVCENQVAGGAILGGGFALREDLILDEKTARVLNPNYFDYHIPTSMDTPPLDISFVEVRDPVGAFGVKGIGEGSSCPTPTAVAQAIYNAIGVRIAAPFTPEKILTALRKHERE